MKKIKSFNLGRYKITKEIGRGSMGVVYLAHDSAIDRVVAVKTIKTSDPNMHMSQKETVEVFLKEAKIAGRLTHRNITSIYDIGEDRGTNFFVMEYVEGENLEDLIVQRKTIPLVEKLRIISDIARTLHYAHMRAVIHRDIKPANIMILKNKEPKIMDFGVARFLAGPVADKIEQGRIFGTPHYMSPEQISGGVVDRRSDIFSLGVLAYEFISHIKPFDGESLQKVLLAIVNSTPTPLTFHDRSLPKELDEIMLHALKKKKEERFSYANQFADALELLVSKMESSSSRYYGKPIAYEKLKVINSLKRNYLFFSDFEEEEIMEIFKLSAKEGFKPGEVIFEEGSRGNKMFIIIEGRVRIVSRNKAGVDIEISVLSDGDCFGEMAILDNSHRSATAVALEETVVVSINEIVLRVTRPELCLKLYKNIASIVAEKLRRADQKMREIFE